VDFTVINEHCEGCDGQISQGCILDDDNKDGSCPCSTCENKAECPELCLDWYKWEESLFKGVGDPYEDD